ncbi:MAG: Kazal-type serine protease inhibitor domain-containing protein [Phyllobacterium sp.]
MKFPIHTLSLAAAMLALAACTVPMDQGRPVLPSQNAGICTLEYVPVCGQRRNDRQTFANSCTARAAGFRVLHRGECGSGSSADVCGSQVQPVCARRGTQTRTFQNACRAEVAGYRVASVTACQR